MLQLRVIIARDSLVGPSGPVPTRCPAFSCAKTPRQIARTSRVARGLRRANAKGIGGWIENVLSSFDLGDREGDKCEEEEEEAQAHNAPDIEQGIMLQGFGWASCRKGGWYNMIKSKVPDIQKLGVTFVWLPPPSQSVSSEGYMPGQLYDLNTPYGKEQELRDLIKEMKRAGIFPMADIVINHRCADIQDSNGIWNTFSDKVKHPGKSIAWGKWAIVGGDGYGGTGGGDTGADFGPAPDLDHNNKEVHESLRDWLVWLHKDVGFYGWRLDYVKGYSAKWVKYYIENSVGASAFNVGEYWSDMAWGADGLEFHQDSARQVLCDYIDACGGELAMFDFPTKGILQEAVRHTQYHRLRDGAGKPPGLLGWWSKKSVTFVDNHDTGSTQNHWPFPKDKIMTGYAYILTHPGMPCLQWEHVFDDGYYKPILQLVRLRRRNNISIRSKVFIECAEHDMYVAHIDNSVIVKLGPRYDMGHHLPRKADGWKLAASGVDFAVWDKYGKDEDAKEA